MNAREDMLSRAAPEEPAPVAVAAPARPAPGVADPATPAGKPRNKRKLLLTLLGLAVLIGALGWGVYHYFFAGKVEGTDDAYAQGNVVQITSQVAGTVVAIHAEDTDPVRSGETLVQLDPADARLALSQAEAMLAQAVRQIRTIDVDSGALNAQISLRRADVARAQAELTRANGDLKRRQSLAANGAVSGEELQHARAQVESASSMLAAAQAGVTAAREQLASNRVRTDGTSIDDNPAVLAAAVKVREAWLAMQRTTLPAPIEGQVSRRSVQLGQRVAPGTPLMSIVPLEQIWVDANFKEGQLGNIRVGQRAKVTADVYGGKIEYDGTVAGIGAGTGSAFALLPAQNATGNWIKVVQRVPVRIELDRKQLADHPLRIGLSMNVEVDVDPKAQGGSAAAPVASTPNTISRTQVYGNADDGATREIERVIAANRGRSQSPSAPAAKANKPAPAGTVASSEPDSRAH